MEKNLENTEQLEKSEETNKVKSNKRKKRVKRILIVLGLIVGFWLLGLLGIFLYMTYGDIPGKCYCQGGDCQCLHKPIIYLYPTTETDINVKLGTPENLSHTYPKYNSERGRNVVAQPDGDLEDIDTGRKLYALYREGITYNEDNFNEGFVVKGEDTIPFLEEKLAILGLNEREAEEFIVYWLPQMENNKYNLIRFETKAEQDGNMPLNITPTPDTVIRVMMDWKAIDEPIDIPEQELVAPERTGFTVVEWGGSPRS